MGDRAVLFVDSRTSQHLMQE